MGLKKSWKSLMPHQAGRKSTTGFCMFLNMKVRSDGQKSGNTPVYLNVYDLTPLNGYVHWAGLGIFHSGVEVHGVEYAFGALDCSASGVFEVEPRQCLGYTFRKSIFIGTTCLDPIQARVFMEHQSLTYRGDTYHLIFNNCNHFSKDMCCKLTGNPIPKWVNRLAKIASFCTCLLPEALGVSGIRKDSNVADDEKRRLRSSFTSLPPVSVHQRELSSSSLDFLPPFEFRRSSQIPIKGR
ncbi:deSI-like protein At4g17486 isoform X2 [Phalaenopsis equestris]|uniref:deSI-like protein At4g17486 isoform X2 n=1 Tax=Phalaenopsis equestris TaxID=78828 RepID=UPI0009E2DCD3|nr:deSI-like protein At4g17486 isoform X2 [Phalaenopsis equestris]